MFSLTPSRETMPAHFWYQLNGKSAEENYIEQMNNFKNGIFGDPFFDRIRAAYEERKKAETKDEDDTYEIKLKSEIRIKK